MKYTLASNTWNETEYQAALSVLSTGMFTMGEKVKKFEEDYASWAGSKYAVFCNSGSSANLLALSALKYDPRFQDRPQRKKIVVPSVSWSTTYMPVLQLGYELVFIDVEPTTFNIDAAALEDLDPNEIFAVFAVNLLGVPCNYDRIERWCDDNSIFLLEDNCESMGASLKNRKTGTFGRIGTHSTFFSHHMATMEGGICITDDELTYEILKSLRAHGWVRNVTNKKLFYQYFEAPKSAIEESFHFVLPGYNFRPTELQGAIASEQLKKLDSFVSIRIENYVYFQNLAQKQTRFVLQETHGEPSWFGFGLILAPEIDRTAFSLYLTDNGVENRPIVSGNMLRQPVFGLYNEAASFKTAEIIHTRGMMIGNHQVNIREEIDYFFDLVARY